MVPIPTARNGDELVQDALSKCRASQPVGVVLSPGVPRSMYSIASKCDLEGSGDPAA